MRGRTDDGGTDYFLVDPLDEAQLTVVEADAGAAWHVYYEPPAGPYLDGRVAKDGSWVEVNRVGFAEQ